MKSKKQRTIELEEKLLKKNSYKEAVRVVKEFLETREKRKKRESIKINPYAEHPWTIYPEATSTLWPAPS